MSDDQKSRAVAYIGADTSCPVTFVISDSGVYFATITNKLFDDCDIPISQDLDAGIISLSVAITGGEDARALAQGTV